MVTPVEHLNPFKISSNGDALTVQGYEFALKFNTWEDWRPEGFRFRTFSYLEVSAAISDGAQIEIKDRGRTPVQAFVTDRNGKVEFYWEQPLSGDLTLLYLTIEGKVVVDHISTTAHGKTMRTIQPGMVMCWFAGNTDNRVSKILETEYPGFDEKDLVEVPYRASTLHNTRIPVDFWDAFDQLATKRELKAPNELDDDGKYTGQYISWWLCVTQNTKDESRIKQSILNGLKLNLPVLRLQVQDAVSNLLMSCTLDEVEEKDLVKAKEVFLKQIAIALNESLILGGISLKQVLDWSDTAMKVTLTPEAVKEISLDWETIANAALK